MFSLVYVHYYSKLSLGIVGVKCSRVVQVIPAAADGTTPTNERPAAEPVVTKPSHVDPNSRKISTASSIGSNQSDGGPDTHPGDKKPPIPSRKISRFLVSPVVDKSDASNPVVVENAVIPDKKPLYSEVAKEKNNTQINGVPDHVPASQVPQVPVDAKPQVPESTAQNNVPLPSNPAQNLNAFQNFNPSLLQPLTTPLQIATDASILGLSQVGTPMMGGEALGLNLGLAQPGLAEPVALNGLQYSVSQNVTPNTATSETLANTENIQRMLLKQNIIR